MVVMFYHFIIEIYLVALDIIDLLLLKQQPQMFLADVIEVSGDTRDPTISTCGPTAHAKKQRFSTGVATAADDRERR